MESLGKVELKILEVLGSRGEPRDGKSESHSRIRNQSEGISLRQFAMESSITIRKVK